MPLFFSSGALSMSPYALNSVLPASERTTQHRNLESAQFGQSKLTFSDGSGKRCLAMVHVANGTHVNVGFVAIECLGVPPPGRGGGAC